MDSKLQSSVLCGNYYRAASLLDATSTDIPSADYVNVYSLAGLHTKALSVRSFDNVHSINYENAMLWAFARAGQIETAFVRIDNRLQGLAIDELSNETKAWLYLKMLRYQKSHDVCPNIVGAVLGQYSYANWQVLSDICNTLLFEHYARRYLANCALRVLVEVENIDDIAALILRTYSIEAGEFALKRFASSLEPHAVSALKGHSAWLQGDFERAEKLFGHYYSVDSNNAHIAFWLGRVHQRSGMPILAIRMFERALQIDSTHFEAQLQLCRTYVKVGELSAAREVLISLNTGAIANVNVLRLNTTLRKAGYGVISWFDQLVLSITLHRATRSWAKYLHRTFLLNK